MPTPLSTRVSEGSVESVKISMTLAPESSALRLITAVALKVTAIWGERRYVDVSLLENQEVDQAA